MVSEFIEFRLHEIAGISEAQSSGRRLADWNVERQ